MTTMSSTEGLYHSGLGKIGLSIADLFRMNETFWGQVETEHPHVVAVPVFFACWASLYFATCMFNRHLKVKDWEGWNIRLVAYCHGMSILILAARSNFFVGPWAFDGIGQTTTPLQRTALQWSLGYFLFDVCWCVWYNSETALTVLHHVTSVSSLVICLCYGISGTEVLAVAAGTEISNPSLQVRWFLMNTGEYDTTLGFMNDTLFAMSFGIARIGFGSVLCYKVWCSPATPLLIKLGGSAMYMISLLWFRGICTLYWKRYIRGIKKEKRR